MPLPNTQTTTYIVGQLYFHVLSSPVPVLVERTELDARFFVRIFPASRGNSMVAWPLPSLSDRAAYEVSHAIFSELDRISRLAGPLNAGGSSHTRPSVRLSVGMVN
jgi:hypothetical protein